MKKLTLTLLLLVLLIFTACQSISEEQAIEITKEFVNGRVKFFTSENESSPIVQRASIIILDSVKQDGVWNIYLNVQANESGETKKTTMVVGVQAKTGEVLGMQKVE